jgi:pilus assembly protein FimV
MAASLAAVTDIEQVADMVADEDVGNQVSDEEVEEHMAAMMAEAEAEEDVEETLTAEDDFDADSTLILPGTEDTIVTQPPGQTAEIEDEADDVTAEADVYLAYGIYQQAEELLKNAIRENPERDAYRVKLAETYYASKDADAFADMATEMHKRLEGAETPAWKKIAAIGKELCPDHALFKDVEVVSDLNMDDLVPKSPEPMDIDLGAAQEDALMPDLDIGFDLQEESESNALDQTTVLDTTSAEPESAEPEEEAEEEGVEFDLSETEAIEPEVDEEFSLDIEASELDIQDEVTPESATDEEAGIDFNLDIGAEAEPEQTTGEAAEIAADDETAAPDIDASDLDFDIGADEESTDAETALDFDIAAAEDIAIDSEAEQDEAEQDMEAGGLDLDLGAEEAAAVEKPQTRAEIDDELDEDIDLSMLDDVDEVSTKLDLARAYLDMGDAEGTRSILDEVIAEGNDDQKQEAEELLKQLDS